MDMSINIDEKYIKLFWSLFLLILFLLSTSNLALEYFLEFFTPTQLELLSSKDEIKSFAYIAGAIVSPGVYEIEDNTRIIDLIQKAGGYDKNADMTFVNSSLNLSKRVFNEDHLFIPYEGGSGYGSSENLEVSNNSEKISLNNSSKEELDTLPGIGEVTVQKIVENRPYSKIEDLLNVEGIGDKKLNEIKELISI